MHNDGMGLGRVVATALAIGVMLSAVDEPERSSSHVATISKLGLGWHTTG